MMIKSLTSSRQMCIRDSIIDDYLLEHFSDNTIITDWIKLARKYVPFQGLPARIGWLGHEERTQLALAVNDLVAEGVLSAPVAFTRDHLDAGAMAHPNICLLYTSTLSALPKKKTGWDEEK